MDEKLPFLNPELFTELSPQEQQIFQAGLGDNNDFMVQNLLYLQNTNIETSADRNLTLGAGDSDSQSTKYKLSQFTLGSVLTFVVPNINNGANGCKQLLSNLLGRLFS
ncbi:hypothetical protein B6N60_00023 [Richelia sinica FACHB-800]|uniref:Uncharacterized protein n=1 Tax=Richelia sinica FACHB-800 TaxID=1357546 RepID=A0A975T3D6_9NOST|nr:hypothetical protein [Richelia sinica]MBD2665585.1 hypothetical protein [Richelia sinica FACHB-800]QXE21349.1 hypothetical protein B6N60_00023 [Richelia sinica FACHB-800]